MSQTSTLRRGVPGGAELSERRRAWKPLTFCGEALTRECLRAYVRRSISLRNIRKGQTP